MLIATEICECASIVLAETQMQTQSADLYNHIPEKHLHDLPHQAPQLVWAPPCHLWFLATIRLLRNECNDAGADRVCNGMSRDLLLCKL